MNAIQVAVVAGEARLGDLESGGVAALVSPTFSVVSGGITCVAAALVMTLALPMFWRLRLSGGAAALSTAPTPHPAAEPSPLRLVLDLDQGRPGR